ncbi:hypothetical protein DPMN_130782 [Dreissena polymorpha]|uniref:Uncharacterized protein n=1 Tax=Dreissena polymorpha TaxID=45954 RepID=A0A9D4JZG7_DREPO|nr:hypothetical protein DPMN_130782 [Dreissena polymorpha]
MFSQTVKDKHEKPRHKFSCLWTLYGCNTDHPGCCHRPAWSPINMAVLNFPKLQCWSSRASKTFLDF